ncbi:actin-like ATPase domain-containing protein [Ramicandelaber brevisporus]|nr:actin-like ATPase domain-containing protein [Ramicandelaber brevisporus]KAI8865606.1 actin-like ATPase domain-containing protein [Ramicandelaber brevisporus]
MSSAGSRLGATSGSYSSGSSSSLRSSLLQGGGSTSALRYTSTSALLSSASSSSTSLSSLSSASLARRHGTSSSTAGDRVVVDIGSYSIKCGFSGECKPRAIITLHSDINREYSNSGSILESGRLVSRGNYGLYSLNFNNDTNVNVLRDQLINILQSIYQQYLLVDPRQRRIVICENPLLPLVLRRLIADVLLNVIQVPSIQSIPSPFLSLLSVGRATGLVVDCGYLESIVFPIVEGMPVTPSIVTTPVAGKSFSNKLREMISEHSHIIAADPLNNNNLRKMPVNDSMITDQLIHTIKTSALIASPVGPPAPFEPSDDCPTIESWFAQSTAIADFTVTFQYGTQTLRLVIPGWVRERAAELLFSIDSHSDELSVTSAILQCLTVKLSQPDLRSVLASSILVVGGTAQLPGFQPRLHKEIINALSTDPKYTKFAGLAERIKFLDEQSNGAVYSRSLRSWVGGSIFGSLSIANSYPEITKELYAQGHPNWSNTVFAQ